jgi:succinyl-diaminopimelate desuccinylase
LAYNTKKRPEKFKIILNAHLDVVPGEDSQFIPKIKGSRIYGRGALDMKCAAAAEMAVFKQMAKNLDYPIGIQLVTDEETSGQYGTKHQIDCGVKADFIICGEPTNLIMATQSKGVLTLKLIARGRSAHSAHLWEGENAIWKLNGVLEKINREIPIPKKSLWKSTQNLASISSNNPALNKVPDECFAILDIRYIPGDKETLLSKIRKIAGKSASVEVLVDEPCHTADEDNLYVKLMQKVIKATGNNPKAAYSHWASDVRYYSSAGCAAVTFGPCGEGMHSESEWVDIKSLSEFYEILRNFLLKANQQIPRY